MRKAALAAAFGLLFLAAGRPADRQKQKEEEPPTQALESFPEPPAAVAAETARLAYHVSPLSAKGLLSQQVRDGLRSLLSQAGGGTIVKLRAFVAGSGDTRRVAAILSETFTDRKLPLPALTVAQVGALPAPGVQVSIEATVETRRAVNPNGLAFISLQQAERPGLEERLMPLAREALPKIRGVLSTAGLDGKDVVLTTCYMSAVEDVWEVRALVAGEFPKAVMTFVQPERAPFHASFGCEVVARLRSPVGALVKVLPAGAGESPPGVLISAKRLFLTGGQLAFGFQEADVQLAFQRLNRSLEQHRSSLSQAAYVSYYVLSRSVGEMARRVAEGHLSRTNPPSGAMMTCVGLPAIDASLALDAVAVPVNP